jgi:NAD(P)-dependent dehydrogenase (short-subunit alcohol dehydrogenase family)
MNNLFNLTNCVVLVTGATGALAGSAAGYLAAQGARVVYLGGSPDKGARHGSFPGLVARRQRNIVLVSPNQNAGLVPSLSYAESVT